MVVGGEVTSLSCCSFFTSFPHLQQLLNAVCYVTRVNMNHKLLSSSLFPQPKVFKEFWFVFRALVGGDKILEYHQNEKKFQECAAYPKGVLHLGSALAVSYHNPEKKQQFSIELAGGSLIFLEAATQAIAREWMTCLNAVLFGKGNGRKSTLSSSFSSCCENEDSCVFASASLLLLSVLVSSKLFCFSHVKHTHQPTERCSILWRFQWAVDCSMLAPLSWR